MVEHRVDVAGVVNGLDEVLVVARLGQRHRLQGHLADLVIGQLGP